LDLRNDFLDYLKRVENDGKAGYDAKYEVWFPHSSPEGGRDTIGYGHKLTEDDNWMKAGVSEKNIEDLLLNDLWKAEDSARNVVDNFGSIPQHKQEMFIDFAFNLGAHGLRMFPKFRAAVLDDDIKTMRQEYKRYYTTGSGAKKELEHRNNEFYNMFLV
jgi:GH24 family phage-related lysozyme (muramidase)